MLALILILGACISCFWDAASGSNPHTLDSCLTVATVLLAFRFMAYANGLRRKDIRQQLSLYGTEHCAAGVLLFGLSGSLIWGALLVAFGVLSIVLRPIILLTSKAESETISIENLF